MQDELQLELENNKKKNYMSFVLKAKNCYVNEVSIELLWFQEKSKNFDTIVFKSNSQ